MFEMVLLCPSNSRRVVCKSVTKSQAELGEPPAPFQLTAAFDCLALFQLGVGVWMGLLQGGTDEGHFFRSLFSSLFSSFPLASLGNNMGKPAIMKTPIQERFLDQT